MGTIIGSVINPLALGNLALWLDGSDSTTLFDATAGGSLPANGGQVARWEDKSGNARHFVQATSGFQPLRQTGVQNGLSVVRFDGTDDRLGIGSSDLGRNITGATVYIVRKWATSPTTVKGIFGISTPTALNARMGSNAGATSGKTRAFGRTLDADANAIADGATSVSTSVFQIDTAVFDYANTDLLIYLNGVLNGSNTSFQTATTTSNTASAQAFVGANHVPNQFGDIDCAELLLYHAAHDAATRQRVRNYLRNKWGF